ncbi:MAG: glycosyltransferase [Gemmatimonadota bacterium]
MRLKNATGETSRIRYDCEEREFYRDWVARNDTLTDADRAAIRAHIVRLPAAPLISVVMPVYEAPEALLRAAVASVQAGLWPHWELCIADDASPSPHVARVLAELAAQDERIRWMRRETNGNISAATNSALALARGEFVALMDHDDLLPEHALYEIAAEVAAHPDADVIYSDEDKLDAEGQRFGAYFKPDFDPDLLLGQNMVSHLGVYRRSLVERLGGLRVGFEGSQDHDLALRATEAVGARRVRHIPAVLYHWRQTGLADSFSQTQLDRCVAASRRAVSDVLASRGVPDARPELAPLAPTHLRVVWPLPDPAPLVSIVVLARGSNDAWSACVNCVLRNTDYPSVELLLVQEDRDTGNGQRPADVDNDPRVRVLLPQAAGNIASLYNAAAAEARGDVLVLLQGDLVPSDAGWLREMVSQALRSDIGAVGAKLVHADDSIAHGGIVLGAAGLADEFLAGASREDPGPIGLLALAREVSAVSSACLATRLDVWRQAGGMDAEHLPMALHDVDYCLRVRQDGLRVLWTPFAELRRAGDGATERRDVKSLAQRYPADAAALRERWGSVLDRDAFYSVNLSLNAGGATFSRRSRRVLPRNMNGQGLSVVTAESSVSGSMVVGAR